MEYWYSKSCSRSRVNLLLKIDIFPINVLCSPFELYVENVEKVGTRFFARDRGQPETTD